MSSRVSSASDSLAIPPRRPRFAHHRGFGPQSTGSATRFSFSTRGQGLRFETLPRFATATRRFLFTRRRRRRRRHRRRRSSTSSADDDPLLIMQALVNFNDRRFLFAMLRNNNNSSNNNNNIDYDP